MKLSGYSPKPVTPWEDASGGIAVVCPEPRATCTAGLIYNGPATLADLVVQYFDLNSGTSRFKIFLNDQQIDEWLADAYFPATIPNGDTSCRRTLAGVALRHGDAVRIEGARGDSDSAALDYVEIKPARKEVRYSVRN